MRESAREQVGGEAETGRPTRHRGILVPASLPYGEVVVRSDRAMYHRIMVLVAEEQLKTKMETKIKMNRKGDAIHFSWNSLLFFF